MRLPWGPLLRLTLVGIRLLASPVAVSVSARLCTDTRFLVAILDAQRSLYGHRNLVVARADIPAFDVLCDEELARLHVNYTVVSIAGVLGDDAKPWPEIHIDLVVILVGPLEEDLFNVTLAASRALGLLRHLTPVLVVHTTELGPVSDAQGLDDVETIVSVLRLTGWMHTMVAVQRHSQGAPLQTVPVYLAEPGFVPGVRCGFGPSTTTLALTWTASEPVAQDDVSFLLAKRGRHQLNGCVVHVAPLFGAPYLYFNNNTRVLQGIDVGLLNYFAVDSNVSINYLSLVPMTMTDTPRLPVNRWDRLRYATQHKKDVLSIFPQLGQADVLVGGLFPTIERTGSFDLSFPYTQDRISGYVIASLPVDAWMYPFAVLSVRVWAAVLALMMVLVVTLFAMGGGSFEDNALIILGILFDGEPKPKLSLRPRQAVGVVFLWTVFCLHFNSGYRANLAMASINPLSRPGPRSLHDVKRLSLLVSVIGYLLQEEDSPASKLNHTIQVDVCRTVSNCSEQIKRDPENVGLIMSETTMWSATARHFLDFNLKNLVTRKETLATYFVSFLFNKDSPLRAPIDRALVKCAENGFVNKALKDIHRDLTRTMGNKLRERIRMTEHRNLILVLGVCGLLVAGLALSLVVFCGELLNHRLRRNLRDLPGTAAGTQSPGRGSILLDEQRQTVKDGCGNEAIDRNTT